MSNSVQSIETKIISALHKRSDMAVEVILISYFIFGLFLSFFYDTYLIAFLVGGLVLLTYYLSKWMFPQSTLRQYMASLAVGLFMAQFIYQMHGLFEMHFTAFLGLIILITYQNWKTMIPLSLFVVVHHASFAYIQYLGYINDDESLKQVYFTQLQYMDLPTFLFHAGLYAIGAVIAGVYSYHLSTSTNRSISMLEDLQDYQNQTELNTEFARQISANNFDYQYSTSENDALGLALVEMRENLKESKQKEAEDRFLNKGLADVAEIIRKQAANSTDLANDLIQFLVKYLNANQGALFFLEEENESGIEKLIMKGCYAYQRKKHINMAIEIGQGLVGQCFLEKDTIYLTDVPESYIKISSGLGDARPKNVIMIPLKNDEEVLGVMEIASFYVIEKHKVSFLEKVGQTIGSALRNVKVTEKTNTLLTESRIKAEEMKAQEEELRQNLEEMEAIQENAHRLQQELEMYQQKSLNSEEKEDDLVLEFEKYRKSYIQNPDSNRLQFLISNTLSNLSISAMSLEKQIANQWQTLAYFENGEFVTASKGSSRTPLYKVEVLCEDGNKAMVSYYANKSKLTALEKAILQALSDVISKMKALEKLGV